MTSRSRFKGRCPPRRPPTVRRRRAKIRRSIASSSTGWENFWKSWFPDCGRSRLEFWPCTPSRWPSERFCPSTSLNWKVWKVAGSFLYYFHRSFYIYFGQLVLAVVLEEKQILTLLNGFIRFNKNQKVIWMMSLFIRFALNKLKFYTLTKLLLGRGLYSLSCRWSCLKVKTIFDWFQAQW